MKANGSNQTTGIDATDPVVTLAQQLEAIDRRQSAVLRSISLIEEQKEHGTDHPKRPAVEVGSFYCCSLREVRQNAKSQGLDPAPYLASYREQEKAHRAWRKAIGLAALDREEEELHRRWEQTMRAFGTTPSASFEGIAAKIALLHEGATAGTSGHDAAIAASALDDLRRLAGLDAAPARKAA